MERHQPMKTRVTAETRHAGPRSTGAKTSSDKVKKVPSKADTRGSQPWAVAVGLNRSSVVSRMRSTNAKPASCAARSRYLSETAVTAHDASKEPIVMAFVVANTPKTAITPALLNNSPNMPPGKFSMNVTEPSGVTESA